MSGHELTPTYSVPSMPTNPRIETIDPLKLLSPNRLDVMGRYVFARQWARGWGVGYGAQLYRHSLGTSRAGFVDGAGRKNGFADIFACSTR